MKYILSCVSPKKVSEELLTEVKSFLASTGATFEKRVELCESGLNAVDLHLDFPHDGRKIKFELMDLSNKHQIDMALIPVESRKKKKLIIFDMDSTLIRHEVINELAVEKGCGAEVKEITERAMNGELNFDEALHERVALLKGLKKERMDVIMSRLELSPGAEKLIQELKKEGYKTAIISGGFKFFADQFKERLGMDYAFANDLEWENGVLTGKVQGKVINAEEKARLVEELAKKENCSLDEVVAVGDGANDLPMLAKAGFGIAFHAKEKVRREASYQMSHGPMTTLLYFLGITGSHFK